MLSEWIHVFPNEWGAEGVATIAAYGMGLQGWDVSYMFQNRDSGGFSERIGRDQWDVTTPQVLCLFPAVARQVLRADVHESEVTARRYVHIPSLFKSKIGFDDKTIQQYDVKAFNSDKVPAQTLAVARSVVEFTHEYQDTPKFDLSPYEKDGWLTSTSGQLRWKSGSSKLDGCFTINTDATKAIVGFSKDQTFELGNVTIQPKNQFSAIYLTATEFNKNIGSSKKILVVAIARARNTGMKLNESEDQILDRGESPILMEPVKAKITLNRLGQPRVYLLDHDGLRTPQTLPVQNNSFEIDGTRDKTCYYLITY